MAPLTLAVWFLLFHVSNCLWTLDASVLVIDMKHAEKKNQEFCCCDDDDCQYILSELEACEERKCDILLSVTVSPCTQSSSAWPCSVSTVEVKDAENFGDYGYFFHFTTTAQANNLTIVIEDKEKMSKPNDLIDEFTIKLTSPGANSVTLTGKEQLATIALSYQIHCTNLPGCPTPSLSPTSCPYVSDESSRKEILMIESSICSTTTVHAATEYTMVTIASTYTSSCPSASLGELTATCTCVPDVSTTEQIAINKISNKTSVEHSTETVTKTIVLTSTLSSSSCKDISALLVTALPPSVDDLGQPASVVGESSKAELIWMIITIFMILLAMLGAGATIVCSLMYFKKCGSTSKMSLKTSAILADGADNPTYAQLIREEASLKQGGSRPGNGFVQDEASRLYDDPSGDTCTSFCQKENGHDKMQKDHLYTYATATEGTGAEKCPGSPMAYETPLPLNREKNQEFGEYSTLKH